MQYKANIVISVLNDGQQFKERHKWKHLLLYFGGQNRQLKTWCWMAGKCSSSHITKISINEAKIGTWKDVDTSVNLEQMGLEKAAAALIWLLFI